MKSLATLVGLAIAALGLLLVATPDAFISFVRPLITPPGLYMAGAIRVGVGVVLLGASGASRARTALRILGVLVIINGLVTPFVGVDRALAVLDWSVNQGPTLLRAAGGIAVVFGGFIVFAVASGRRQA